MDKKLLISLYRQMLRIRLFEERVRDEFMRGAVKGMIHMYIGQEAVAAGVCSLLNKDDYITSTHRGHGHILAKGGDMRFMMAELFGKATGYCKGKGGSMHIADIDLCHLGANGIVAEGMPIAAGAGIAIQLKKEAGRIVVCFFGDGALNTGEFHESLNLAGLWKLPVIFVCENNLYAISTSVKRACAVSDIAKRADGYDMPGVALDGMDILAVRKGVETAIARARQGGGPTFLVCNTYRFTGHGRTPDTTLYRTRQEEDTWKERCPIRNLQVSLLTSGALSDREDTVLRQEIQREVDGSVRFAKDSPFPAPEELTKDIYVETPAVAAYPNHCAVTTVERTYREAIRKALQEELRRDPLVFLMGEEIGLYGGAFSVTKKLYEEFGGERIKDMPISEAAIVGAATGAAAAGMRPVVEIMYIDFITFCLDQIVNQAAKMRYMFGGKIKVPLVIRTQGGAGACCAAQHSQSLESWFIHVPGVKVVMPSTPSDAKGLLKSSIRDDNVVLFIEHKMLYNTKGPVPDGEYTIPFGVADIKRKGKDITLIAWSRMVLQALEAAEVLAGNSIDAEVIDLRTLNPLDMETVVTSVRKTGRAAIIEEGCKTGGVGAEILARINERAFDYLDAPVGRIAGADTPIPFSPVLENIAIPDRDCIVEEVRRML